MYITMTIATVMYGIVIICNSNVSGMMFANIAKCMGE